MSFQAFHETMFSQEEQQPALVNQLLHVAEAPLSDVLAVRSELAWDPWGE